MSFEVILAIISLLLQAIGILVAVYGNSKPNKQRDIDKKRVFKPANKTEDMLKLIKHISKK